MKKICFKCGKEKDLDEFYKHPQMPDGHVNKCKECNKQDVKANYGKKSEQYREYDKHRQRHSRTRIFNHRYTQIKQRIEGRATRTYKIEGKEMLSYEEYCVWLKNNMDSFERLYEAWQASNFARRLTPSIDRIDNSKSYTPDNMQWISLLANTRKYTN